MLDWGEIMSSFGGTHVVLLTELLGERSAHDDTALVRGSLEVSGTALASGRRDDCIIVRDCNNKNKML